MSKYESEFAQKGYGPLPGDIVFVTRPVAYLGKQLERKVAPFTPFPVDILVDEYLTLNDIGLNIEIIHTPGHSQRFQLALSWIVKLQLLGMQCLAYSPAQSFLLLPTMFL